MIKKIRQAADAMSKADAKAKPLGGQQITASNALAQGAAQKLRMGAMRTKQAPAKPMPLQKLIKR